METRCIKSLDDLDDSVRGCVVTIGNFDGVHQGHRRLVSRCRELAGTERAVVALTFDPSPDSVLRGGIETPRVDPVGPRCRQLREAGCDWVVIARADAMLLGMTPDEFVERLLMRRLAPSWVVEGVNFHYGVGRSGNICTLKAEGARCGFAVEVVPPVMIDIDGHSQRVSSTLVRRLVSVGDVEGAARCLTRPFTLYGPVVHGLGKGRTLDCPTANLEVGAQIMPADGVYAGWGRVGDRRYPAAISIGNRPTLKAGHAVEAFLLGLDEDLYGRELAIEFIHRLRGQETYATPDDLKRQIAKDIESVRRLCYPVCP